MRDAFENRSCHATLFAAVTGYAARWHADLLQAVLVRPVWMPSRAAALPVQRKRLVHCAPKARTALRPL